MTRSNYTIHITLVGLLVVAEIHKLVVKAMRIFFRFFVMGWIILMTACVNIKSTIQVSPSQTAITPVRTIAPTGYPLSTPTPTIAPFLSWSKDIQAKMTFLGKNSGTWSPTANELLLVNKDSYDVDWVTIKKAGPPDFDSTTLIKLNIAPVFAFASWSPDGQNIVFAAPLPHSSSAGFDGQVTLWGMDRNGKLIRPLKNGPIGRAWYLPSFYVLGWIDNSTVVYASPSGTCFAYIEGIDISNGKTKFGESATCRVMPPYKHYIPFPDMTSSGIFIFDSTLFDPSFENPFESPYILSLREGMLSIFQDWISGTDTILMVVTDFTGKNPYTDLPKMSLSKWNLDTKKVDTILPNAVWGRCANGNRYIAYITLGPTQFDAGGKPVEFNYAPNAIELPLYLNLYDVQDKKVVFSSQVLSVKSPDDAQSPARVIDYLSPIAYFSPDGHYLSFVTVNSDNVMELKVLELETRQVVFTLPTDNSKLPNERYGSEILTWSPDSTRLLYRDSNANPVILYVETGKSVALTSDGGFRVDYPAWSFDGHYLLVSFLDSFDYPPMWQVSESAVIYIP